MASPDRPADDLYAKFYPRRTRAVALTMSALVALGALILLGFAISDLISAPTGDDGRSTYVQFDVAVWVVVFLLGAALLYRHGTVSATVTTETIHVRNLVRSATYTWQELVTVRLGERPWVQVDLSDGKSTAIMAIQRSDGARAQREAERLATLVAIHGTAPDN